MGLRLCDDPQPFGRSLEPGLDQPHHLGSDPAILAGALPAGAADVAVRAGPTQAPPGRLVSRGTSGTQLEGGVWELSVANFGPFETAAQVLAARDGRWLAVAECGGFAITVRATGRPPTRLDLEPFRPGRG